MKQVIRHSCAIMQIFESLCPETKPDNRMSRNVGMLSKQRADQTGQHAKVSLLVLHAEYSTNFERRKHQYHIHISFQGSLLN